MKTMVMFNRLKVATKVLLGRYPAARNALIYSDDVVITSYPKSGNTWVRFLVANLISDETVSFSNIERIVPDIYVNDPAYLLSLKRPRILKSHECFCPYYKRVIYIVRNPLDVAVSYFFHLKKARKMKEAIALNDAYINDFIVGKFDGFGSWGRNVGSWLCAKMSEDEFLMVRYEDLLLNPETELKKIALFLGIRKTNKELTQVVMRSSFKNMKTIEATTGKNWKPLKNTRDDIPFIRSGKSGEWKHYLSKESASKIEGVWRDLMIQLRYL